MLLWLTIFPGAGRRITLLEKEAPGAGATCRSFTWINAGFSKQPLHYHTLNKLGVWAYHLLEQELPSLPVEWGGCLQWHVDDARAEQLKRQLHELQQWGYDVRSVSEAEFHSLEPDVRPGNIIAACFAEQEGFANPTASTELFLKKAREAGRDRSRRTFQTIPRGRHGYRRRLRAASERGSRIPQPSSARFPR